MNMTSPPREIELFICNRRVLIRTGVRAKNRENYDVALGNSSMNHATSSCLSPIAWWNGSGAKRAKRTGRFRRFDHQLER